MQTGMTLEQLRDALPEHARDLKLNLSALLADSALDEQQLWGSLLVAALCTRERTLIEAVAAECRTRLSPEAQTAARAAAAIMAMNNVYYRFTHQVSNPDYRSMRAGLRMNFLLRPGVPKRDFELWCLVASAVNGCGTCMDAHERTVREAGLDPQAVQTAVRAAAVVAGLAVALVGSP